MSQSDNSIYIAVLSKTIKFLAFQIFHTGKCTFINSFVKTKLSSWLSHHYLLFSAGIWRVWSVSDPCLCWLCPLSNASRTLPALIQVSCLGCSSGSFHSGWYSHVYRQNLTLDWPFLFPTGSFLCQEQHSDHCISFRTSAHNVVVILLWSTVASVYVSCWLVLLLLQTHRCKHIHHHVWCNQHLLCCK